MKLLLVEDNRLLSKNVAKGLTKKGYAVDCAYDGEEALALYDLNEYDLMILDLNLPKVDGMDVLRTIRQKDSELKIIILSARTTVDDKIEGLDSGSNDYLTKPFDFGELEARIRSLLRRRFSQAEVALMCGNIRLNMASKTVTVEDKPLALTKKEYSILEYLMSHKGTVISPEQLIEHVWDSEADLFSNSFKFHIHSLKKKLEEAGAGGYVVNVRGQGYRISDAKEVR